MHIHIMISLWHYLNLKSLFLRVRLDAKNRQQRRKVHADTRDSIQKLKKSEIQLMVKVCTQKELNNFSTSLSKIFPSRSKWTSIPFRKTSCSGPKHCLVECLWQRMFVYLLKWIPGKQFVLNLWTVIFFRKISSICNHHCHSANAIRTFTAVPTRSVETKVHLLGELCFQNTIFSIPHNKCNFWPHRSS